MSVCGAEVARRIEGMTGSMALAASRAQKEFVSARRRTIAPTFSTRAGAMTTSWVLPGLNRKSRGRPSASVSAWILVVRPPRERPMACSNAPLFHRPPSDAR